MKHTPGPWVVEQGWTTMHNVLKSEDVQIPEYTIRAETSPICKVMLSHEANARLIAAAPDCLHALELVLNNNRVMNALDVDTRRAITDAITKATGG